LARGAGASSGWPRLGDFLTLAGDLTAVSGAWGTVYKVTAKASHPRTGGQPRGGGRTRAPTWAARLPAQWGTLAVVTLPVVMRARWLASTDRVGAVLLFTTDSSARRPIILVVRGGFRRRVGRAADAADISSNVGSRGGIIGRLAGGAAAPGGADRFPGGQIGGSGVGTARDLAGVGT